MTGLARLPELRGELSTREADLAAAAGDFGNLVRRRPLAVFRPADAADVAALVRYGRAAGVPVVPRGAGHSVDGQSQVQGGITVDLRSLATVRPAGPDLVSADAGARWSAVVDATLPGGLVPPVLPDYLELTVGGTLAVGGLGGASHRYGSVADNVRDLDVVTPDGTLLTCSPTRDADLFDAVRGTQGQYGIITRATVSLTPAPGAVRHYRLPHRDLGTLLGDQLRLIADGRFDHVEGQARYVAGAGWRFVLEAVAGFTPPEGPDDRELLAGLRHERGGEEVRTLSPGDFLRRAAPVEALLRSRGSWQHHPHPRCNVLLPGRHAEAVIAGFLDGLDPGDLGADSGLLLYPVPTGLLAAPNVPKAHDIVTVLFGVHCTVPPGDPGALERIRKGNEALRTAARQAGGSTYGSPTAYHEELHRGEAEPAR
ncbi:FAD-binding protein [Kitasatospora sp. HPMI-4]|uniref:FAD-binding protein n=1 Tax=Kitasatospora sp. HPMI-4 TaxID=3448443 RepID=UPI003F1B5598